TGPGGFVGGAFIGAAGIREREEGQLLWEGAVATSITVRDGGHTRLDVAFITPPTTALGVAERITLHAGALAEVAGLAAGPLTLDTARGNSAARLVLVDAMELAWQRAKYRGHQHLLLAGDPVLVGLNTLQHWLWQRLQTPGSSQVAA